MEHSRASGFSHIRVTAGIFLVALIAVGAWETVRLFQDRGENRTYVANAATSGGGASSTTPENDPIAAVSTNAINQLFSAYAGLQQYGAYSTSSANEVGGAIGQSLSAPVSYHSFAAADIKTASDTSYQGMLSYRAALQASLKPLMQNTAPEYELFGLYVQTKQRSYLDQLSAAAANYHAAASSTAAITVPADAVAVQLQLLNSMEEFAADLDALISHAQDPIASTVLLENYNQGESDVLSAFQALVTYEKSKKQ